MKKTPSKEKAKMTNESVEKEAKENTFKIGETAVFDEIRVTANEFTISNGKSLFKPEDGKTFVGANFTIENVSDKDVNISSILLFDAYCDDVKSEYSFNAACAFSDGTIDGKLAPGKKMTGWYAVEVPVEWKEIEMQFKDTWLSSSYKSAKFIVENN